MSGRLILCLTLGSIFFISTRIGLSLAQVLSPSSLSPLGVTVYKDFAHIWIGGPFFLWRHFVSQGNEYDGDYCRLWFWLLAGTETLCAAAVFLLKKA